VYYFRSDPRSVGAVVVLMVDESSYTSELFHYFSSNHSPWLYFWPAH
jgi:hypothetical protein